MHLHAIQFNSNTQMEAIYATAKAEAKMAAERTRKKLIDSASELAGEVDIEPDCVLRLSGEGAPQDQASQQDAQNQAGENERKPPADAESIPFSNWI